MSSQKSQADKFKEAARELEADEDEKPWQERLKKVAKHTKGGAVERLGVGDETENPAPDKDYSGMETNEDDNEGSAEADDEEAGES